ncbi:hypothetical protein M427DRAFT_51291 [Gonapodya prolifera JEL478]|uniref:S15/NS1 RNA-binding domain-containing protein n=1 Tax=Gonapodya prolifera (strain JEL478) TaxID=1344416 RepID=A0A139AYY2_GONPJ|nr:hypothetical protein M427DRAFT_51291 [Gonapodya prolifera JEL478]|eukprot:KXS21914.1 hypothetical protein M427DRAFT_51291 [Gonapodya prolifera JEL478]
MTSLTKAAVPRLVSQATIPPISLPSRCASLHTSVPSFSLLPWARKPSTRDPRKLRAGTKRTGHPGPPIVHTVTPKRTIVPFLASKDVPKPPPVIEGNLEATLSVHYGLIKGKGQWDEEHLARRRTVEQFGASTSGLNLPEMPSSSGPYYKQHFTPSEVALVLKDFPAALSAEASDQSAEARLRERAEMVRRATSLENAGQREVVGWNVKRVRAVFGRGSSDTGSPEVQAAILTVRILNLEKHLSNCTKRDIDARRKLDDYTHQRRKLLLYLKRTVSICG